MGRWVIAPIRRDIPAPPAGLERRKRERMALELAGLCLGLVEGRFEPPADRPPAPDELSRRALFAGA